MSAIDAAPSIVLRMPQGPAVQHLILRVPPGGGRCAVGLLARMLEPGFGVPAQRSGVSCSIGFGFAGLEALALPPAYLRVFRRLAPAFAAGAVLRSARLGDSGTSAASGWRAGFGHQEAHVLVSWHGARAEVEAAEQKLRHAWQAFGGAAHGMGGDQLGAPPRQSGEWVHFGLRDGLSEVCIDDEAPQPDAPDLRRHARGALLLGHANDAGFNPFALARSPDKVRRFFHGGSFGVLRPMLQDLRAFESAVGDWQRQLEASLGAAATRDFVKAKLCGRWPDGRVLQPSSLAPASGYALQLDGDPQGHGCPFGSHVRRMRAAPDDEQFAFERPLQRRGIPFGPAAWGAPPDDGVERGLLGHFFCASIEQQFEHLVGQWAARAPLGRAADDDAADPLTGPHRDATARLTVPLPGHGTAYLDGLRDWVTTLGTMYAWYPSRNGWRALVEDDFVPDENEEAWV